MERFFDLLPAHSCAVGTLAILAVSCGLSALAQPQTAGAGRAIVLEVEGAIGPAISGYLTREIEEAAERGAGLVILHMDTPGGLDTAMRDIIRAILASSVPVATYVAPSGARAASAGTYILYASHIAAMARGTNLGAATPIQVGGGGLPFGGGGDQGGESDRNGEGDGGSPATPRDASEAKAVNDAIAYIRSLAELRGRNAEWAERAVSEAASLPANEAVGEGVIDFIAADIEDLLTKADGRVVDVGGREIRLATAGLAVERVEPDWATRLLAIITNPNVALILMMIGVYGLLFEFMSPGALFPGIVGAISLVTGLYALAVLPVNIAGVALVLLGIGLMTAEAFAPSFGILGIGGAAALALGATIMIDIEAPGFEISWSVVGLVLAGAVALSILVVPLAVRAHRRRVVSGREEMVGAIAEVIDWRNGRGHVRVHGEHWSAIGPTAVRRGDKVRVKALDGLTLTVERAERGGTKGAEP